MKKLLAIAVVLTSLFLGGCVAPGFNMSGSIGIGPQGYGVPYGGGMNANQASQRYLDSFRPRNYITLPPRRSGNMIVTPVQESYQMPVPKYNY